MTDEWSKFSAEAAWKLRPSPDCQGSCLGCGSLQRVKPYIITESLSCCMVSLNLQSEVYKQSPGKVLWQVFMTPVTYRQPNLNWKYNVSYIMHCKYRWMDMALEWWCVKVRKILFQECHWKGLQRTRRLLFLCSHNWHHFLLRAVTLSQKKNEPCENGRSP